MPIEVEFQPIVDKYAKALAGPKLLFDFWPKPRTQGRPWKKYTALAGAVTLGVTGAFEAFAEDLLAAVLLRRGHGWAHVAANADLTNPSLITLREMLQTKAGIAVAGRTGWALTLPKQQERSAKWSQRPVGWGDVLKRSASWIEVRHCLAHGAVTGIGAESWPGPVFKGSHVKYSDQPSAKDDDILARIKSAPEKRALYLWPSVSCARIFSAGGAVFADTVAAEFGEVVDASGLHLFDDV